MIDFLKEQLMRQQSLEKMPELDQSLIQWITALADRIKNPAAGMTAAMDILEREIHQMYTSDHHRLATVKHAIFLMRRRLLSLSAYIEEVSEFSRPINLHCDLHSIDSILQSSISMVQHSLADCSFIKTRVLPAHLSIECDAPKIRAALVAIITNGIEAVPAERNPEIEIFASACSDNSWVEILVTDNGSGFDSHAEQLAVRPFFSTKTAGSGLGLAIANTYLTAHQGSLRIESMSSSDKIQGSCVHIRLPLHAQSSPYKSTQNYDHPPKGDFEK